MPPPELVSVIVTSVAPMSPGGVIVVKPTKLNSSNGLVVHDSAPWLVVSGSVMDSVPMERYYDYTLNENGRLVHYGNAASDYSTTVLSDKAVSFIDQAARGPRPFFLYFAPGAAHAPHQVTDEWVAPYAGGTRERHPARCWRPVPGGACRYCSPSRCSAATCGATPRRPI